MWVSGNSKPFSLLVLPLIVSTGFKIWETRLAEAMGDYIYIYVNMIIYIHMLINISIHIYDMVSSIVTAMADRRVAVTRAPMEELIRSAMRCPMDPCPTTNTH